VTGVQTCALPISLALSGCDGELKVTIFKDGRALIHGKISPERARGWYSEVVGC
jgi:adenylyltransferase/sulfurtransferase